MKRNTFVVVLLIVISILGGGVYYRNSIKEHTFVLSNTEYAPVYYPVATTTPYASATGTYPKFEHASNTFNQSITSTVAHAIVDHMVSSQENWMARLDTASPEEKKTLSTYPSADDRYSIEFHTAVLVSNNTYASTKIETYDFTGGAHGNLIINTFNYSYALGRALTLSDLFPKTNNYLQKLSKEARQQLPPLLAAASAGSVNDIDMQWIKDGTEATTTNFESWTLNPDQKSIIIYFQDYQVAAHVFGPQQIIVPLPSITTIPNWLL